MAKWGEGDPRWIVEERPDATNVNNWHWYDNLILIFFDISQFDYFFFNSQGIKVFVKDELFDGLLRSVKKW